MAKAGGSRGSKGRPSRPARAAGAGASRPGGADKRRDPKPAAKKRPATEPAGPPPVIDRPFVLGAIAGATPGKWIDAWHERMPGVGLDLRPIALGDQRRELLEGGLDAALVRLPIDSDGLHV